MRSVHPSPAITTRHPALLSWLQTLGMRIGSGAQPAGHDLFLVAHGEYVPLAARTLVIGEPRRGDGQIVPFRSGNPARLAYSPNDAATGDAFAHALIAGLEAPAASDPETLALFALAARVAQTDIPVLISGPAGTGKDVLARFIHDRSPRSTGPFVSVNCAALSETMLEALLFGHDKGASRTQGGFRAAHGGTLLLDEIAGISLPLQAKLLRAIQQREVVPLGAGVAQPIDVRIVACAGGDLQAAVSAGKFRTDLFYRLAVFPLTTRALRDRPGDIAALAATMILRHAGARTTVPWPGAHAMELLRTHDWPGNVRELDNVIQRALLFAAGDTIDAHHIVFDRAPAPRGLAEDISLRGADAERARTLGKVVQMSEFAAIRETLRACGGSRIETARRLGISERTLRYRLARARREGEPIDTSVRRKVSA
ncbi:sigma-54 dependent transcriptional regulator [Sphingomonas sp.]|jgi:two-component system response regulator FlrC|uniref:sigma-54 dependent transcriptional regulator n=1 Tax=Sphingomonas sp. TaxID=28214 RepID=UPI002ED9976F